MKRGIVMEDNMNNVTPENEAANANANAYEPAAPAYNEYQPMNTIPPVYGAPMAPAPTKDCKGLSIAALVLGIVSIVMSLGCCCIVPLFLSLPCAIAGLICSLVFRAKTHSFSPMALAGFICSIVGLALSVIMLITVVFMMIVDTNVSTDIAREFADTFAAEDLPYWYY